MPPGVITKRGAVLDKYLSRQVLLHYYYFVPVNISLQNENESVAVWEVETISVNNLSVQT